MCPGSGPTWKHRFSPTFIAILFALEGVNVQMKGGAEIVEGIGTLINGLAGKFLSSIVALFLAVSFSIVEKKLCEPGGAPANFLDRRGEERLYLSGDFPREVPG
jgi:hypothetical protein